MFFFLFKYNDVNLGENLNSARILTGIRTGRKFKEFCIIRKSYVVVIIISLLAFNGYATEKKPKDNNSNDKAVEYSWEQLKKGLFVSIQDGFAHLTIDAADFEKEKTEQEIFMVRFFDNILGSIAETDETGPMDDFFLGRKKQKVSTFECGEPSEYYTAFNREVVIFPENEISEIKGFFIVAKDRFISLKNRVKPGIEDNVFSISIISYINSVVPRNKEKCRFDDVTISPNMINYFKIPCDMGMVDGSLLGIWIRLNIRKARNYLEYYLLLPKRSCKEGVVVNDLSVPLFKSVWGKKDYCISTFWGSPFTGAEACVEVKELGTNKKSAGKCSDAGDIDLVVSAHEKARYIIEIKIASGRLENSRSYAFIQHRKRGDYYEDESY